MDHWCLIPPTVLDDVEVPSSAKLLFGRILGLTQRNGYCWATNEFLAEQMGVDARTVRRHIGLLKKKDYLSVEDENGERRIVCHVRGEDKNVRGGRTKMSTRRDTYVTGTESTQSKQTKKHGIVDSFDLELQVSEVFDYWCDKYTSTTGKTRRPRLTDERRGHIQARLRDDGRSVAELKRAIDGCMSSEFHVENRHLDLTLILRNDAKVDMFIDRADAKDKKQTQHRLEEWKGW